MSKITETTLLPLSLVTTIIGGVIWLSVMYQKVEAHQERLDTQRTAITELRSQQAVFQKEVIDRLARIETKQDAILHHK